jgi:hypothetical protein
MDLHVEKKLTSPELPPSPPNGNLDLLLAVSVQLHQPLALPRCRLERAGCRVRVAGVAVARARRLEDGGFGRVVDRTRVEDIGPAGSGGGCGSVGEDFDERRHS